MSFNFRQFVQGVRIVPKTPLTATAMGDMEVDSTTGKLNYHNGTTESPLITATSTDTLTNKTIDANSNTISNLADANIKVGAGINANKIADGSVSNANYETLAGVTSNIQTQLDNKASITLNNLSTTAINASLIPGSDNAISLGSNSLRYTTVNSLEIKNNTGRVSLTGTQIRLNAIATSDPSSPAQGDIYFNSSTLVMRIFDGSVWKDVGSGAASGANQTLSNLTSPTAINQNLLPSTDVTYDLGNGTQRWSSIWGDFIDATTSLGMRDTSGNPILTFTLPQSSVYTPTVTVPQIRGPLHAVGYDSIEINTRDNTANSVSSGSIYITTANGAGSGNIYLTTTVPSSGTRGSIILNGFTFPNTDGTPGQVLSTNGSKVLSFVNNGSGTTPVSLSYGVSTGSQNFNSGVLNTIIYDTLIYDTNSAFNTGTGIFTVPVSGKYNINSIIAFNSFISTNAFNLFLQIQVNGTAVRFGPGNYVFNTASSNTWGTSISTDLNLTLNDQVAIRLIQSSGTTQTLQGASGSLYHSILNIHQII